MIDNPGKGIKENWAPIFLVLLSPHTHTPSPSLSPSLSLSLSSSRLFLPCYYPKSTHIQTLHPSPTFDPNP